MFPIQIAVATEAFRQPLKPSLMTAANMGASAVQLNARSELQPSDLTETGRRHFLHHLDEIGITIASLTFPTRHSYTEQENLDARIAATKAAMDFAWGLKANVLTVRLGRVPGEADGAQRTLLVDVLNGLAGYGNRVGVTLAATPHNTSAAEVKQLQSEITEGLLGINFDPAAFVLAGENPSEAYQTLYQTVVHVQVRDAVRDVDGSGLEVPLGRGEVDWDELLALFDEAKYKGWSTVTRTQGDNRLAEMSNAVQYLKRVWME